MVVVSYSGREINAKLVYYGAGLSGKTTNLESIYEAVPDTSRGKMVSMKTQSDRTLFFDLLPLDLGEIMGFKTRFLLYTVPGQVFYNATRKLVLKGADAVVFVADSERGKMDENQESLANLRTNLQEYGVRLEEIPWALQYNKRDLDNVYSIEELNAALNPDGSVPWFEAVANQGKGVFETFRGVSHMLMEKVTKDLRRTPLSPSGARTPRNAEAPVSGTHKNPLNLPGLTAVPPTPAGTGIDSVPTSTGDTGLAFEFGREVTLPADAARPAQETPAPVTLRRPEAAPSVVMRMPVLPPTPPSPAPPAASLSRTMLRPEPMLTGNSRATSERGTAEPAIASLPTRRPGLHAQPVDADSPSNPSMTEAVVPISIPKGGTREIVLRIVITDGE